MNAENAKKEAERTLRSNLERIQAFEKERQELINQSIKLQGYIDACVDLTSEKK